MTAARSQPTACEKFINEVELIMTYRLGAKTRRAPVVDFVVKSGLVMVGGVIGLSMGFWVAVKTIPLPEQTTVYMSSR